MLSERVYISQFDIRPNGMINVRVSTDIMLNDNIIASGQPWRCALRPNDPEAELVLGAEPFYLNLARQVWASLPEPDPATSPPPFSISPVPESNE